MTLNPIQARAALPGYFKELDAALESQDNERIKEKLAPIVNALGPSNLRTHNQVANVLNSVEGGAEIFARAADRVKLDEKYIGRLPSSIRQAIESGEVIKNTAGASMSHEAQQRAELGSVLDSQAKGTNQGQAVEMDGAGGKMAQRKLNEQKIDSVLGMISGTGEGTQQVSILDGLEELYGKLDDSPVKARLLGDVAAARDTVASGQDLSAGFGSKEFRAALGIAMGLDVHANSGVFREYAKKHNITRAEAKSELAAQMGAYGQEKWPELRDGLKGVGPQTGTPEDLFAKHPEANVTKAFEEALQKAGVDRHSEQGQAIAQGFSRLLEEEVGMAAGRPGATIPEDQRIPPEVKTPRQYLERAATYGNELAQRLLNRIDDPKDSLKVESPEVQELVHRYKQVEEAESVGGGIPLEVIREGVKGYKPNFSHPKIAALPGEVRAMMKVGNPEALWVGKQLEKNGSVSTQDILPLSRVTVTPGAAFEIETEEMSQVPPHTRSTIKELQISKEASYRKAERDSQELFAIINSGMPIEMILMLVMSKIAERSEDKLKNKMKELAVAEQIGPSDAGDNAGRQGINPTQFGLQSKSPQLVMQELQKIQNDWKQMLDALNNVMRVIQDMVTAVVRNIR